MTLRYATILISCFFISEEMNAQAYRASKAGKGNLSVLQQNGVTEPAYMNVGDTSFLMRGNCKNYWDAFFGKPDEIIIAPVLKAEKLIRIHGNISYNYLFNSLVDTPFAEKNLSQHIVQTNFNFLVKDKYPLRVTISNRRSNSQYFENATDVYLHFKQSYLLDNQKEKLRNRVRSYIDSNRLTIAELQYKEKLAAISSLKSWLGGPAHLQQIVEERERFLDQQNGKLPQLPQLDFPGQSPAIEQKQFSARQEWYKKLVPDINRPGAVKIKDSTVFKKYEEKKKELEKMEKDLRETGAEIVKAKKSIQDSVQRLTTEINKIKSKNDLENFLEKNDTSGKRLTRGERILLSVNQFGLGRTWLDYSELTVKNLAVNGINLEINPSKFYFAMAAGKVNYRFR